MHGYSDRINHAFAFAAKYYVPSLRSRPAWTTSRTRPTSRSSWRDTAASRSRSWPGSCTTCWRRARPTAGRVLEQKIGDKFGPVALAIARDALEPKYDRRGGERPWQQCKPEYLTQLATAEPRALDICVADELHACGSTITALRRLGVEYLRTLSRAGSEQTIWWYRSMLEILEARAEWPRREMLGELRIMSADLVRSLRHSEEEL